MGNDGVRCGTELHDLLLVSNSVMQHSKSKGQHKTTSETITNYINRITILS